MANVSPGDDTTAFDAPLSENELASIYNSVDALTEGLPAELRLRVQPDLEAVVRRLSGGTLPPHLVLKDYGDWELRPAYTWKEPAPGASADCAIAHAAQTAIEAASRQISLANPNRPPCSDQNHPTRNQPPALTINPKPY